MKFTSLVIAVLLLTTLVIPAQETATKPQDPDKLAGVKKLEDQIKELERTPGTVKVRVSGKRESDASINVAVETTQLMAPSTEGGKEEKATTTKTLDIDLKDIDVPDEYIDQKVAASFLAETQIGNCPGVKVSQIGATRDYDVVEDYVYDSGTYKITAWKGFRYDRASIPRIFWVIIDKDSLSNVAPLFHDLLYRHGGKLPQDRVTPYRTFSRAETDNLFKELMGKCGVGGVRRELAYRAVRDFGSFAWNGN